MGDQATQIADLSDDSRSVGRGFLFIARSGTTSHGRRHIEEALRRGATAVISDTPPPQDPAVAASPVAWAIAPQVDLTLTRKLAETFFDRPASKLKVVGVTGTNGKTTTCFLIRHILARAGHRCGMITTVVNDDGLRRRPATLTTPGPVELARSLAAMVEAGCRCAVVEVSSHALDQGRCDALSFDTAVFTNLTGDHLDYHGDMQRYADAKARLFEMLPPDGAAVVNADDPHALRMLRHCRARALRCRLGDGHGEEAECRAESPGHETTGTRTCLRGPWGRAEVHLPLAGRHNVMNSLQAAAAAWTVANVADTLAEALTDCPAVPGRLEPVSAGSGEATATVLVDYAHTHDALENALQAVRPLTRGKLTVVFGCGGDRDTTKRPRMGEVACRLADRIYVTSDNPRTEPPLQIIRDIVAGIGGGGAVLAAEEPDRRAAIFRAIEEADPQDVVLIAGKGHEVHQIVGAESRPFDDRVVARAALQRRAEREAT